MKSDKQSWDEWNTACARRVKYFDGLGFSCRVVNALAWAEYESIEQVAAASDAQLLRLPNFGRRALAEVRNYIRNRPPGDLLRTTLQECIERTQRTLDDLKEQLQRLDAEQAMDAIAEHERNAGVGYEVR